MALQLWEDFFQRVPDGLTHDGDLLLSCCEKLGSAEWLTRSVSPLQVDTQDYIKGRWMQKCIRRCPPVSKERPL